jgi:hypothetical protein
MLSSAENVVFLLKKRSEAPYPVVLNNSTHIRTPGEGNIRATLQGPRCWMMQLALEILCIQFIMSGHILPSVSLVFSSCAAVAPRCAAAALVSSHAASTEGSTFNRRQNVHFERRYLVWKIKGN